MRRVPFSTLGPATLALAGALGLAGATAAQEPTGDARGLRYLSWSGRTAPAPGAEPSEAPAPSSGALRRPNRVIPHGGAARAMTSPAAPAPAPARRTLTPANAWLRPTSPPPAAVVHAAPPPAPPAAPAAGPALPDYLPDQGGQPAPAAVAYPEPPVPPPANDPLAPRRDAPIFRMQRSATPPPPPPAAEGHAPAGSRPVPAPVATVTPDLSAQPPSEPARYYSVHRQNGRRPDPLRMPESTYVDAMVVTMPETLASQDLAQPQEGPALIRDAQGRLRAQPAAPEGDYQ